MEKRGRFCLLWSVFLLWTGSASAQVPVPISKDFKELFLTSQVALLEDSARTLTSRDVVRMPFRPNVGASINLSFTMSYYWVKFSLYNPDSLPRELLLDIENPHLNKLRLYTLAPGGIGASQLTGDHFPFAQRPLPYPHFVFPLRLPPRQTTIYYLWADKHGEQLQIPLRLWDKGFFERQHSRSILFIGSMLGVNSLYCLISLLVFLFFRQKLTLYYWLYTVFVWVFLVAHTGLGFQYLWPQATWWASAARPTSALCFYSFSLLFARRFFNLSHGSRILDWFTKGMIGWFVVLLLVLWAHHPALGLVKNYWYNPVYYEGGGLLLYMKTVNLSAFIFLLSLPIISIYLYIRERKTESLWYGLGSAMLLLGGVLVIFVFAGYLPDNYLTQNAPLVTNALETVILSFLLANRFRNIYLNNNLISIELSEQRRQNTLRLLEGQVQERHRLSQELHDGLSLSIANIRLRMSLLADRLNGERREADALVEDLGQIGQDVRQFSHALSPILLERNGLVAALDDLLFHTRQAQPNQKIEFVHETFSEENIPSLIQQTLYQIVLELVNNMGRHAKATHGRIRLSRTPDELRLEVWDNGVGYAIEETETGIGLANVRSRADLFGGSFHAERLPEGMKHEVRIPV